MNKNEIINHRKNKFLSIGRNRGFEIKTDPEKLSMKKNALENLIKDKKIIYITGSIILLLSIIIFLL